MRPGLVAPRIFTNDAIDAQRIDEHINRIASSINGGLTVSNLNIVDLSYTAFLENFSIYILSAHKTAQSNIAGEYQIAFGGYCPALPQNTVLKGIGYMIKAADVDAQRTITVKFNGTNKLRITVPAYSSKPLGFSGTVSMVSGFYYPEFSTPLTDVFPPQPNLGVSWSLVGTETNMPTGSVHLIMAARHHNN